MRRLGREFRENLAQRPTFSLLIFTENTALSPITPGIQTGLDATMDGWSSESAKSTVE
jgi:hypothetical protein